MSGRLFRIVTALLVVLLPGVAAAQTGTITGLVRDSSGAAVPGAIVRVVAESTRTMVETVTNELGLYRADGLTAGPYRVETTLDGFETAVRRLVLEGGHTSAIDVTLTPSRLTEGVIVTARRIEEAAQEVPIPVSVVSGDLIESVGAFNVNRVKDLIPTVQFYSTNPRNSAVNIRGLGAPFGLTNDGIEPGVGLYIDGVFYARPAAATLDFLDVERIEVLRGPQGTLFGKNTTAGAINVTTRRPSFTRQADFELNYGDLDFVQAKGSISGPLLPKVAGRLSFSGTQRDGTVQNTRTQSAVNDLDNLGARGQLLFAPSAKLAITATADHTRQRPEGYTQVVAGVAPTLRNPNRQYP
jgi:iron complex outermembrane receptor protein